MGRTVYWMGVSIDGFIEAVAGEHDTEVPAWARIDERLYESFNQQLGDLALLVEGRVIYEMMEAAWSQAGDDESLPGYMREFGRIWTTMPKAIVSRTRTSADHNTVVIGGDDVIEQLAAIRADTEGTIGVGGATLATALLRAGLLDELLLYVHPAVLGSGRPLFDDLVDPLLCDLIESTDFPNGVALRRYSVRGAR
jgi:dihydrofolate reductase